MKIRRILSCAASAIAVSAYVCMFTCGASAEIQPDVPAVQETVTENNEINIVKMEYDSGHEYDNTASSKNSSSKKKEVSWPKIILISLGISALVTGITVFYIYNGYKNNGKTEPYKYNEKAPLELSEMMDTLVDVRVTKRHIERNNN